MSTFYDKAPWRERSLEFYRACGCLWDKRFLRCSLLEMFGGSGPRAFLTLWESGIFLTPEQFIGVDLDFKLILKHQAERAKTVRNGGVLPPEDRLTLVLGDAYVRAHEMSRRPPDPPAPPVGIFVFDGTTLAGQEGWWVEHEGLLQEVVANTHRRLGFCAMVLNVTLDDRGGTPADTLLVRQTELLCGCFRAWGAYSERILGKHLRLAECVKDRKFTGWAGAHDVYKSVGRPTRMATLRMLFQGGKLRIHKECKR